MSVASAFTPHGLMRVARVPVLLIIHNSHTATTTSSYTVVVCRLQAALKLAHLHHQAGDSCNALRVARSAAAYAASARSHRNTDRASATPDSTNRMFLHMSASRSQPTPQATKAMAELTEADEAAAHLHSDVIQLLFELELAVGLAEQRAAAEQAVAKAEAKLQQRREQVCRPCCCDAIEHVCSVFAPRPSIASATCINRSYCRLQYAVVLQCSTTPCHKVSMHGGRTRHPQNAMAHTHINV